MSTEEQTEGSGPIEPIGGDMPQITDPPVPSDPPPGNDGTPTFPPPARRRCMGKKPVRHDPRTLMLRRYLPTSLPPPPVSVDWTKAATPRWGMMKNDELGDCTGAAVGHAEQDWTANNGSEFTVTDADVVAFYSGSTGYNPADPSTDQGGVELDVLNYWRKTGMAGRKIRAFVALEPKDRTHVQQSVFLFGGCYIGLALPAFAENQGTTWTIPAGGDEGSLEPGSWGGHAVWVLGYDQNWVYFISWGEVYKMSWAFWNAYCDESYACLSDDWCSSGEAPSKFDLATLEADLNQVTNPASSSNPATAAAAQQARREKEHRLREGTGTDEDHALTVTKNVNEKAGVGSVTAVNDAGDELGVTILSAPDEDPTDAHVQLRLLLSGKGSVVTFSAKWLGEFVQGVSEICDVLLRPRRPAEQPEQQPPTDPPTAT